MNAIEKLQRITKEKETQNSEYRRRHDEELELLRRTKIEEELNKAKREGMLNIQPLAIKVVVTFIIIFGMCRREGV